MSHLTRVLARYIRDLRGNVNPSMSYGRLITRTYVTLTKKLECVLPLLIIERRLRNAHRIVGNCGHCWTAHSGVKILTSTAHTWTLTNAFTCAAVARFLHRARPV